MFLLEGPEPNVEEEEPAAAAAAAVGVDEPVLAVVAALVEAVDAVATVLLEVSGAAAAGRGAAVTGGLGERAVSGDCSEAPAPEEAPEFTMATEEGPVQAMPPL
jgi:hypothetical protein